jgi:hypothetical protein
MGLLTDGDHMWMFFPQQLLVFLLFADQIADSLVS